MGGLVYDGLHRTEHRPQSRVDTANIDTVTTQQSQRWWWGDTAQFWLGGSVDTTGERTVVWIPVQSPAAIAVAGLAPVLFSISQCRQAVEL